MAATSHVLVANVDHVEAPKYYGHYCGQLPYMSLYDAYMSSLYNHWILWE